MTPAAETAVRTVAFGDLDGRVWGVAVIVGEGAPAIVVGAAGSAAAVEAGVAGAGPDAEWRITGDGLALAVSAEGVPVLSPNGASGQGGFDQLCRVTGELTVNGTAESVASLGIRGAHIAPLDRGGSLRRVAAWFDPPEGLALAAFRPGGASGQEADVVSAAVLDSEHAAPVEDPRLSTTYSGDGWPIRAGLELWLGGDEDQQFLRRAAGEATGARGPLSAGELKLRVELFRFHSRGRDGTGVYVLATRR